MAGGSSYVLTTSTQIVDVGGTAFVTMPAGTVLEVTDEDEHWMRVTLPSGRTGFAPRGALEPAPEPTIAPQPPISTRRPPARPATPTPRAPDPVVAAEVVAQDRWTILRVVGAASGLWAAVVTYDYYRFREPGGLFLSGEVRDWLVNPAFALHLDALRTFRWWMNPAQVVVLLLGLASFKALTTPSRPTQARLIQFLLMVIAALVLGPWFSFDSFAGAEATIKAVAVPTLLLIGAILPALLRLRPTSTSASEDGLVI